MKLKRWFLFLALALCLSLTAVTAQAAAPVQETEEENDSPESAQLIEVNKAAQGTFSTNDDYDYYKFTLTDPGAVRVRFQHEALESDTVFWNVKLLYSDEKPLCNWNSAGSNTDLESNPIGLPAGTYYVLVQHLNSFDHSNVPYTLTAEYEQSDIWETERNDDMETADLFNVNTEVHGNLMTDADADFSRFEVKAPGCIQISFNHPHINDGTVFWTVTLYDSNRKGFYTYQSNGKKSNIETPPVGVPAGTYYVSVQHQYSFDHSSAPYAFTLNYTESSTWETEPNPDGPTADLFPVNTEITGALITDQDTDCYKFVMEAPGAISLSFKHGHLDSSTVFWNVILSDDKGNQLYTFPSAGNKPEVETAPVGVPAGTYYVTVDHQYSFDHSAAPYTLEMDYIKSDVWEKELNNDKDSATPIQVNTEENGRLMKDTDEDYYSFELSSADEVSLQFKHDHREGSTVYWVITVMDQNGNDLKTFSSRGNAPVITTETFPLEAGSYYVCIKHQYSFDHLGIPYQFTVNSPQNAPAHRPEYELGDLVVRDLNGKALPAIPDSDFLVTVPITKRTNDDSAIVMVAAYTAAGQQVAFRYVTVDGAPLDGTVRITFPHDHSAGKIARVKAFVIQDFNRFQPIGEAKEFPRMG